MEVTSREKNNIIIYDIKGEFGMSDEVAAKIQKCVKDQLESGRKEFIFNFEKVDFIDSFGIGGLVSCYISITKMRGKLKIIKIPRKIRRLFKITMLDRIFETYDDEKAAIKSFVEPGQSEYNI